MRISVKGGEIVFMEYMLIKTPDGITLLGDGGGKAEMQRAAQSIVTTFDKLELFNVLDPRGNDRLGQVQASGEPYASVCVIPGRRMTLHTNMG